MKSSTEIVKKKDLGIDKVLKDLSYEDTINIGDIFFTDRERTLLKIREIKKEKRRGNKEEIIICYDHNTDYECTKWSSYGSQDIEEFIKNYGHLKLKKPLQEYLNQALDIINGKKSIDDYKDKTIGEESSETSLMSLNNKETLTIITQQLEIRKQEVVLIKKALSLEMEKRKAELESIKSNLGLILKDFEKKIDRIQKVIYTIELYLGINEDIVQIQDGNKASIDEPIVFRQRLLYMDEEVGDPGDDMKGLDFRNIEDFDSWLLNYSNWYKKPNYEVLVPEQKCIVALRVRKDDKKYSLNPYVNSMMNQENKKTYFLIRNGQCVYRIWGDLRVRRLFPLRSELQELKDQWDTIDEAQQKDSVAVINDRNIYNTEEAKEKINDKVFRYKQQLLLLQGLIDRTEVFHPVKPGIHLLNEAALSSGLTKFIYDDEMVLQSNRPSFRKWLLELNSNLTEGSKVMVCTDRNIIVIDERQDYYDSDGRRSGESGRFDERFNSSNRYASLPKDPHTGIYTVYYKDVEYWEDVESELMDEKEGKKLSEKLREDKNKKYDHDIGRIYYPNYRTDKINDNNRKCTVKIDVVKKIRKQCVIKYNPKDKIGTGWSRWDDMHERKNRLSWEIYPDSDMFIINYDLVDIKDIEYYLYDRSNREYYITIMPLLKDVLEYKKAENKKEKLFIDLLANQFDCDKLISIPIINAQVSNFKYKVKWKRAIDDNDEKSWTIIKQKVSAKIDKYKKSKTMKITKIYFEENQYYVITDKLGEENIVLFKSSVKTVLKPVVGLPCKLIDDTIDVETKCDCVDEDGKYHLCTIKKVHDDIAFVESLTNMHTFSVPVINLIA